MRILFFFGTLLFGMYIYMSRPISATSRSTQTTQVAKARFASSAELYAPETVKRKASPIPNLSESDLYYLTDGGWKFQSIISDKPCDTDGDGMITTDITSEMTICALDDVMFIHADGTVDFKRNMACDTEAAVESYYWSLSKNGIFKMRNDDLSTDMNFVSVSKHRLIMVIPQEANGEMFHFTVTYAKEIP